MRDDPACGIASTISKYLGANGMGRFRAGRYAPEDPEVAMLGCVQAHDPQFWFRRLSDEFVVDSHRQSPQFAVLEPLTAACVVSDLPYEWLSVHATDAGKTIRVFHLFIDCQ